MIIENKDKEVRADAAMLMGLGAEKLRREILSQLDLLMFGQKGVVLGALEVAREIVQKAEVRK